jgi:2-haloacid dehalogenase
MKLPGGDKMIEFLLIDLDDTILDFHKAEKIALGKTLQFFGIDPTEPIRARYSQINKEHWERLERKELTRQQVVVGRFAQLFDELGMQGDAERCAELYAENLSIGHYFLPGAVEALEILSKRYRLFLASNGNLSVQRGRLSSANIGSYFEDIFISQEMGADKPSIEYFERCFARIPGFDKTRALIVGDSLSSDILGGQNAGIATCWINPKHKECTLETPPDYQLESITQLEDLLENM